MLNLKRKVEVGERREEVGKGGVRRKKEGEERVKEREGWRNRRREEGREGGREGGRGRGMKNK